MEGVAGIFCLAMIHPQVVFTIYDTLKQNNKSRNIYIPKNRAFEGQPYAISQPAQSGERE
jgi:hypothetical protein